jgi:hypothetical protein
MMTKPKNIKEQLGAKMFDMHTAGNSYGEIGNHFGYCREAARRNVIKHNQWLSAVKSMKEIQGGIYNEKIGDHIPLINAWARYCFDEIGQGKSLSEAFIKILNENKIESFRDLLALSPEEFRSIPTVGWKTFRKIQEYLSEYNIIWD